MKKFTYHWGNEIVNEVTCSDMWVELCLSDSVTCLQGYIRWDLFVFGAQPWDISHWVFAGTTKCCFLLTYLSVLHLSLRFPHFLGAHPGFQRWWAIASLVTRVHSRTIRRRSHQVQMDSLIQKGDSFSQQVRVRALDAQWHPVRTRNQWGEGCTAHQTGKNRSSNSRLPQEAEGETDHLLETASNSLLGWSSVSQVQRAEQNCCAM
jgi:hypothetical protein